MLLLAPLHKSSTEVVNEEGEHETGHEDGGCSAFVLQFAETSIAEHQVRMREQMNKSSGDDDTCAELLENDKDDVVLRDEVEPSCENGQEDSGSTSNQDDEEKADS